ncbi:MAG: ATP-binding protein [Pseudomonadota bacterium]
MKSTHLKQGNDNEAAAPDENREMLDRFASIAAHDLKAPLRQIDQVIAMMREDMADRLQPDDTRHLNLIEQRTNRLRHLVKALLDYSCVASAPLRLARLNLGDAISEARLTLKPLIDDTGAKIEIDALPCVDADMAMAQQLFQILLLNSMNHHGEGDSPQVHIFAQHSNAGNIVFFKDNGIGIAPEIADRVFEPFAQTGEKANADGAGMGLTIAKIIAFKHGWSLSLDPTSRDGATFQILIPD